MKLIKPAHNFIVLTLVKEKEEIIPGKLIVPTSNNGTKIYEILEINGKAYKKGAHVLIKGYSNPVEIEGQIYYIVNVDDILAEIV
jgi:co-chaperonin GroES (HSP10)